MAPLVASLLGALALAHQAVAMPQLSGPQFPGFAAMKYMFVFGDSYTTVSFDPLGAQPSPSNPLGNPPYPGWVSSNGPNWVDYLTTTYNKSYIQTYDLAYGGATVDSALVTPWKPTVLSLKQQVQDQFIPIYGPHPASAPWSSSDSLFAIWIGINDVGNSWWLNDASLNGKIMAVYSSLVEQLYAAGARNFLFLNVPPVDRSPLMIAQGAQSQAAEAADIAVFNNMISDMVHHLRREHKDVKAFLYDTNRVFNRALDHPGAYPQTIAYKNTTAYCDDYANGTPQWDTFYPQCGIPVNQYFWLNSLHPTYPMHAVVADQLAELMK